MQEKNERGTEHTCRQTVAPTLSSGDSQQRRKATDCQIIGINTEATRTISKETGHRSNEFCLVSQVMGRTITKQQQKTTPVRQTVNCRH